MWVLRWLVYLSYLEHCDKQIPLCPVFRRRKKELLPQSLSMWNFKEKNKSMGAFFVCKPKRWNKPCLILSLTHMCLSFLDVLTLVYVIASFPADTMTMEWWYDWQWNKRTISLNLSSWPVSCGAWQICSPPHTLYLEARLKWRLLNSSIKI